MLIIHLSLQMKQTPLTPSHFIFPLPVLGSSVHLSSLPEGVVSIATDPSVMETKVWPQRVNSCLLNPLGNLEPTQRPQLSRRDYIQNEYRDVDVT